MRLGPEHVPAVLNLAIALAAVACNSDFGGDIAPPTSFVGATLGDDGVVKVLYSFCDASVLTITVEEAASDGGEAQGSMIWEIERTAEATAVAVEAASTLIVGETPPGYRETRPFTPPDGADAWIIGFRTDTPSRDAGYVIRLDELVADAVWVPPDITWTPPQFQEAVTRWRREDCRE